MNKRTLTLLSTAALLLAGCGTPESTTTATETTPPAASTTTTETTAPTPTSEQPTTPTPETTTETAKKTSYAGTTLKGNDISFEILDSETQTDLNVKTQSYGLVGAWGRLCSAGALIVQLEETGVLTQSPVTSDSYVWRSLKYALAEGGRVSDAEYQALVAAFSEGASGQVDGKNCILVNTDMKWVLDHDYEFVTVGQYVGSKELLNTVDIY